MESALCTAPVWSRREFSGAQLGDARRERRLVRLAAALADGATGNLHAGLCSWAELKAAYRLVGCEDVTFEAVCQSHWERTRAACEEAGEYFLVEDTTQLDYTAHWATAGLGRIGDNRGRGFYLHSTLALRVERWNAQEQPEVTVAGLLHQQIWTRSDTIHKGHETRTQRLQRPRESQRWAAALSAVRPGPERWTYIADRESDIYEVFSRLQTRGVECIIRANQPRRLTAGVRTLFEQAQHTPRRGEYRLKLRARPGVKARQATLEVRAGRVTIAAPKRPHEGPETLTLHVVQARELHAPRGVKPIQWVLLTTWPCATLAQSQRALHAYEKRWLIEEYHKSLKTGAQAEESQLMSAHSLQALLGILAIVAVRLLQRKLLAQAQPQAPVNTQDVGPEILQLLQRKFGAPPDGWTHRHMLITIARLGGFMARKSDGLPGWQSLWKGWHKLMAMREGYLLAMEN